MSNHLTIVGGGVGGLVTALLHSQRTDDTITVIEKGSTMGGRLSFVKEGSYQIDGGPTIVLLPDMLLSILEEGGISRERLDLISCDPLYTLDFHDGTEVTKYKNLETQRQEIEKLFPGEGEGFLRFMKDMKWRFSLGQEHILSRSFVDKKQFFKPNNLRTLVKLKAFLRVKQMLKTYFKSEYLQDMYALQTLYIGGHPSGSPAIYSLVSYSEHEHGIWYLKGGYASLVPILTEELERRGVELRTDCEVSDVKTDEGRATEIKVNDRWEAVDQLVLNGDFPVMDELFQQKEQLSRSYTPSSGCLLLYMGLDQIYDQPSIHRFFMSKNFDKNMHEVFQSKVVPSDPSFYTFHPSIIDDTLAPEGEGVLYTLVPVPSGDHIDWENETEFVERILDELEARGYPDLRKHIQWMKVKTPNEAKREGLFDGGSFGIAPTLFQSGVFRPQLKPYPLENVFAVGASIHPGGGVPIVMQGAKLLADYLHNENYAILQQK
ncbi:capsular polysaccharide biosynthesis protein CpsH [Pontibacillus halophilus JSM 076056 = DSM 19796]|uniref:Capsular polysaccharide biosynthesis protein CpsH n=1 Tax=Pontibacillus halophilus JSM 076056 = DSM 19796 TaxID=1385510 RepID=A0A0A5GKB9_9BACI|nr:phytoene desaturase family protein [Pontibacillus halophilus]KGX91600.1 capsular polysaccharide biosynthesis protein CpsH [Pontibacillus halophilus JSM 076056 = DSM 19796]